MMNRFPALALFLVLVVGGGLLIGFLTAPGQWYAGLAKPAFTPPGWLFAPVWTALYVIIAIVGWRTWRHARRGTAMKLWWTQLGLNFAWSPIFFGAHQIGLALVIVLALLICVLAFIAQALRQDRTAALLFVPYAAWSAFACLLNGALFLLN